MATAIKTYLEGEYGRLSDDFHRQILELKGQIEELRRPDVYVDENGEAWTAPTPWAYAQVCKALQNAKHEIERLKGERCAQ